MPNEHFSRRKKQNTGKKTRETPTNLLKSDKEETKQMKRGKAMLEDRRLTKN